MRAALIVGLCILPAACAELPDLDRAGPVAAAPTDWPQLLPLDRLLARRDQVAITPETNADLLARAAALRARAARLRRLQVGG